MIIDNKFEDPATILKLFLLNMSLLTPEDRHIIVGVLNEIFMPKYKIANKMPIEEEFIRKHGDNKE